jgi:hypothetical protein
MTSLACDIGKYMVPAAIRLGISNTLNFMEVTTLWNQRVDDIAFIHLFIHSFLFIYHFTCAPRFNAI